MDQNQHKEPAAIDPSPSRTVALDFPTLGRLVETEAKDLLNGAVWAHDEIIDLARGVEWPQAIDDNASRAAESSTDELIARLHAAGSVSYKLARHVRTMVELRSALQGQPTEDEVIH